MEDGASRESTIGRWTDAFRSTYSEAPWHASQCITYSLPGHRRSQAPLCVSSLVTIRSMADRNLLDSFLRRSVRLGYHDSANETIWHLWPADDKLFDKIISHDNRHLLYPLFPPEPSQHYLLCKRSNNLQLPPRTSALCDCNFVIIMLCKDINCSVQTLAKL